MSGLLKNNYIGRIVRITIILLVLVASAVFYIIYDGGEKFLIYSDVSKYITITRVDTSWESCFVEWDDKYEGTIYCERTYIQYYDKSNRLIAEADTKGSAKHGIGEKTIIYSDNGLPYTNYYQEYTVFKNEISSKYNEIKVKIKHEVAEKNTENKIRLFMSTIFSLPAFVSLLLLVICIALVSTGMTEKVAEIIIIIIGK